MANSQRDDLFPYSKNTMVFEEWQCWLIQPVRRFSMWFTHRGQSSFHTKENVLNNNIEA